MLGIVASLSCSSDDGEAPGSESPIASLELTISDAYAVTEHSKPVVLYVEALDVNGNELFNAPYTILVNGEDKGKLIGFNAIEEERFELQAVAGNVESNTATVKVRERKTYEHKTFQVVFHIAHDGEDIGTGFNISQETIDHQMELLKKVFELSVNLSPNSVRPNISFEMTKKDPEGNTLIVPGVNRFRRPDRDASIEFEEWMWDHYWDPDYYINIWVGETKSGNSWGMQPAFDCSNLDIPRGLRCVNGTDVDLLEGVFLDIDHFFDGSWVFPHEMGHVFGLTHPFLRNECSRDVDYCEDTRQYDRLAYENEPTGNERVSCTGEEYTSRNLMDYVVQLNGTRELTYDQVERIRAVIDEGLWRGSKSLDDGTPRDMSTLRNGG